MDHYGSSGIVTSLQQRNNLGLANLNSVHELHSPTDATNYFTQSPTPDVLNMQVLVQCANHCARIVLIKLARCSRLYKM